MSSRTRRRLVICFILAAFTLPVDAILLPVAHTPDPAAAATEWAEALSPDELHRAAFQIDEYPELYRRAILSLLGPEDRSAAWRVHLLKYKSRHPDLSADQTAVIEEMIELATADAFSLPVRDELKQQIKQTFENAVAVLGHNASGELFVTLGPKTSRANALPITRRLADRVRLWRVASASSPDCNCNMDIDTCDISWDPWLQCSEKYSCNFDLDWPMCGPLWAWACTGWCRIIRWPSMDGN